MKLAKKLFGFMILITREVFHVFILSVSIAVILSQLNAHTYSVVGLLIPIGVLAGALKGFTKFMLIDMKAPFYINEYLKRYPKYKILLSYMSFFFIVMAYYFGLYPIQWYTVPVNLLKDNILLNTFGYTFWISSCAALTILGLLSHVFDPPFNKAEELPVIEIG